MALGVAEAASIVSFHVSNQAPFRSQVEDHPVDGLEDEGFIVEVDQLHECMAERQAHDGVFVLGAFFSLLPDGLGGGQGMIPIAHGVEKDRSPRFEPVFCDKSFGIGQSLKATDNPVLQARIIHPVAADSSRPHHQLEIVEFLEIRFMGRERADDRVLNVIDEDHDMGNLQRRPFPDLDPGRYPRQDRPLGRPDEALGPFFVIIVLQIQTSQQALADARTGLPLHIDKAQGFGKDLILKIDLHVLPDAGDPDVGLGFPQIDLGIYEVQGRGRLADKALDLAPIFGLRSKLVTGDHGPPGIVGAGFRKEDVRNADGQGLMDSHGRYPISFS